MKKYFLTALCIIVLGAYQASASTDGKWGIEFASGSANLGGVYYAPTWCAGTWLSITNNDATAKTELTKIGLWGGLRNKLDEGLYIVYGLDGNVSFGKESGSKYDSNYSIAPCITLEKELSKQLMISVWSDLIQYSYCKVENASAVTTITYLTSSLSIKYFF